MSTYVKGSTLKAARERLKRYYAVLNFYEKNKDKIPLTLSPDRKRITLNSELQTKTLSLHDEKTLDKLNGITYQTVSFDDIWFWKVHYNKGGTPDSERVLNRQTAFSGYVIGTLSERSKKQLLTDMLNNANDLDTYEIWITRAQEKIYFTPDSYVIPSDYEPVGKVIISKRPTHGIKQIKLKSVAVDIALFGSNDKWNVNENMCVIDYLTTKLNKTEREIVTKLLPDLDEEDNGMLFTKYKNVVREGFTILDIERIANMYNCELYVLSSDWVVISKKHIDKSVFSKRVKLYLYVNNSHVYPIENEHLQKSIKNSEIGQQISYPRVKFQKNRPMSFLKNPNFLHCSNPGIDDYHQTIIYDNQNNDLTKHVIEIYKTNNCIPANIRVKQGHITALSYNKNSYILHEEADLIKQVLSKIKKIVSPVLWPRYEYSCQTVNQIIKNLLDDVIIGTVNCKHSEICDETPLTQNCLLPYLSYREITTVVDYDCFDIKRCHTACLINRQHDWPIYTIFDHVEKYDSNKITSIIDVGRFYISKYVKLNGDIMLGKCWVDSELCAYLIENSYITQKDIKYQFIPSFKLPNTYFKEFYDIINKINLPDKFMKNLFNHMVGSFGSLSNKSYNGFLTTQKDLAVSSMKNIIVKELLEDELYLCYFIKKDEKLNISHRPLWQAVIDMEYIYLDKLVKATCDEKSEILSIKTDSISIRYPKKNIELGDKPGQIRLDKPLLINKVTVDLPNMHNYEIDEMLYEPIETFVFKSTDKELSTNINNLIDMNHGFILDSGPGLGKTYTVINSVIPKLAESNKKFIITSLSHKALSNYRSKELPCKVLCSLFPSCMSESQNLKFIKKSYDYVIVDEYTMCTKLFMSKLYKLWKLGVKIIFVGDKEQLKPPEDNVPDYLECCFIKQMFMANITLKYHSKCRYDKDLLKAASDVLNGRIPKIKVAPFSNNNLNLCYYNKTVNLINNNKSLNGNITHFISTTNNERMFNNERFELRRNLNKNFDNIEKPTSKDIYSDEWLKYLFDDSKYNGWYSLDQNKIIDLTEDDIKSLKPGHAITIHKSQGSTYTEEFTIHDVNKLTRRLLYTAITRATKLSNVSFNKKLKIAPGKDTIKYKKRINIAKTGKRGYIYVSKDLSNNIKYIGSTTNITKTQEEHNVKYPNHTFEIMFVISFNDINELKEREFELIRSIYKNDQSLLNVIGIKDIKKQIESEKEYELCNVAVDLVKTTTKTRGSISTTKTFVEVQWYNNDGSKRHKRFKYKKCGLDVAMKNAKEFQATL